MWTFTSIAVSAAANYSTVLLQIAKNRCEIEVAAKRAEYAKEAADLQVRLSAAEIA